MGFQEKSLYGSSLVAAGVVEGTGGSCGSDLWDAVFSRENLSAALARVEKNAGVAGVDGVTTKELRGWLGEHWSGVRQCLDAGVYRPGAVRQVLIPKPDGRMRELGIPNVVDRLITQALVQVLSPIFDPGFSPVSYGFRPGKSAQQAAMVAAMQVEKGYSWVVEVDLDSFFDRVGHDRLMARVARRVKDKRVLKLIRAYLNAGIMADGVVQRRKEGTPQGSPLSPLLSNIMLDDFDREFWDRGYRFVRYADDIRLLMRSKRAAQHGLVQATRFLEDRLGLLVNQDKSSVKPASRAELLGFGFWFKPGGKVGLRVSPKALARCKDRLRELTKRRWSIPMGVRIHQLNQFIRGWMGYFRIAGLRKHAAQLDEWLRRRLRQIRWKEWKRPRTRVRMLRSLGVRPDLAYQWGMTSKAYWRIARSPILHRALGTQYWSEQGLYSFTTVLRA